MEVSAGGNPIDIKQVQVKYIDDTHADFIDITATLYLKKGLLDDDTSILRREILAILTLILLNRLWLPGKSATIQIIPEKGTMVIKDIVAPSTFGGNTRVSIIPVKEIF